MLEREVVILLDIKGIVSQDIFCSLSERVRVELIKLVIKNVCGREAF